MCNFELWLSAEWWGLRNNCRVWVFIFNHSLLPDFTKTSTFWSFFGSTFLLPLVSSRFKDFMAACKFLYFVFWRFGLPWNDFVILGAMGILRDWVFWVWRNPTNCYLFHSMYAIFIDLLKSVLKITFFFFKIVKSFSFAHAWFAVSSVVSLHHRLLFLIQIKSLWFQSMDRKYMFNMLMKEFVVRLHT